MFARVATFNGVDLEALSPVMAWYEQQGRQINSQMAGYEGSLSLLDRSNQQGMDIHFFDTESNAASADELMDQGPPPEMPDELKEIMMGARRSFRAVMVVFDSDGRLSEVLENPAP